MGVKGYVALPPKLLGGGGGGEGSGPPLPTPVNEDSHFQGIALTRNSLGRRMYFFFIHKIVSTYLLGLQSFEFFS